MDRGGGCIEFIPGKYCPKADIADAPNFRFQNLEVDRSGSIPSNRAIFPKGEHPDKAH
jgi:hypothetical protein